MDKIEVYCHIPVHKVPNVIDCGLKLSEVADREIEIEGISKKCFPAFLSPEDDILYFRKEGYRSLKLELRKSICRMADDFLFELGKTRPEAIDMYKKSIIPVDQYVFGRYRKPVCLVSTTLLQGEITILNDKLDSPVLFRDSEELYTNSIVEDIREKKAMPNDKLLYGYFMWLEAQGSIRKIEDIEKSMAVFIDNESGEVICVRIPK